MDNLEYYKFKNSSNSINCISNLSPIQDDSECEFFNKIKEGYSCDLFTYNEYEPVYDEDGKKKSIIKDFQSCYSQVFEIKDINTDGDFPKLHYLLTLLFQLPEYDTYKNQKIRPEVKNSVEKILFNKQNRNLIKKIKEKFNNNNNNVYNEIINSYFNVLICGEITLQSFLKLLYRLFLINVIDENLKFLPSNFKLIIYKINKNEHPFNYNCLELILIKLIDLNNNNIIILDDKFLSIG